MYNAPAVLFLRVSVLYMLHACGVNHFKSALNFFYNDMTYIYPSNLTVT